MSDPYAPATSLLFSVLRMWAMDHGGQMPSSVYMSQAALDEIEADIGLTAGRLGFHYPSMVNGVDLIAHPLITDPGNMLPMDDSSLPCNPHASV